MMTPSALFHQIRDTTRVPLDASVFEIAVVRPHGDGEGQGEREELHIVRITLCDGSLRGFELGRELAGFALAHRQEAKLCFQGLRNRVVLSGDDWKVVADLLQDAL